MKQQTTFFKMKLAHILSCFLLLVFSSNAFYGQTKVLANDISFTNNVENNCGGFLQPSCFTGVFDKNEALNFNNSFARLVSSPGITLGIGNYDGILELKFPNVRPANSWSYIQIGNEDKGLLDALLGGNLGNLLKNVVGVVAGGSQVFTVDARLGAGQPIDSRNSNQGFNTDRFRLIEDVEGNYFIAIRPSTDYDRFRITNSATFSALGLGMEFNLRVYNAFYYKDDIEDCGRPTFTSFDGSEGLSLSVLPVDNNTLGDAIDADLSTFSILKSSEVLGLSVAGSISQNFYFPTSTNSSSTVSIKLGLAATGVLDLKVLSGIDIIFKNNGQEVASRNVTSGLLAGTDILGLLQSNNPPFLTFGTGEEFDQIEIRSSGLVKLNVLGAPDVKIYDVQRYDGSTACLNPNISQPTITPPMLSSKNCATNLISHSHANFPANVVDGNNDTFTTLEASSGIAVGIGAYSGHVEMEFAQPVPAGETTYVRIDFDNEVLGGLLNGSVAGLDLAGTVGSLLFGNHYFTVEGKNNGTTVFSRSSNNGFVSGNGNGKAKIIQDKNGHYYVAITPEVSINSVRITEKLNSAIGLGTVKTMNVYHACYSTGSTACEQGFATYSESQGILDLDLLGLGQAGVTDAQYAIDGDINTASKVSIGAVGVGTSMFQHVQFHGLSSNRDHFRVKMKMNASGFLDADVVGSIIVKAFKGDVEVYSQRLNEKLIPGLDILGLLSSGQMINVPFAPGVEFDRVAVGISSLVTANVLASPLEIYSIERFGSATCMDPELQWDPKTTPPFNDPKCGVSLGSFENVNFPFEAITDNEDWDTYATITAGAGIAGGLGSYSGHIELNYGGSVPAHEVSYIRVDSEGNLFDALLGGSLGDVLGDVLGSVVLGDQYIVVQAIAANGNPIGNAYNSKYGFDTEFAKLVKDEHGRYYLAVTAPAAYAGVRVEYHHKALIGGSGSSSINVYSMCRETEFNLCDQATFTSWDGKGLALDVLNLTNGGVSNPEFAIDDNSSNYSTLNLGVVGAAASVSQKIYFKTKSSIADELRVRLQLGSPGILNVDLFGNSKLIFYNGEDKVNEMTLKSGLINNLDLLGLFNSGGVQSFTFAPGVVYDRVELKISSLVAVGTSAPVRLYGMTRLSAACPDPDFLDPKDVFKSPVCADGVTLSNVRAVDDVDLALDGDYNSYATMRADSGIIFGIGNEESILELGYSVPVAANTTSYLRIGDDVGVLESLLSGSIGQVVYGLVNQVALGNNYFVVRAKNAAGAVVLVGSSKDNFAQANGLMKIVQDKAGRYFVAISPEFDYSSVEIKAFSEGVIGITAKPYNLHIYGMCYETDFSGCEEGFTTSWDGQGLNLGITGAAAYGVINPQNALNNNNNGDFSTLSLGAVSVGGQIQQNIQYNKVIPANSTLRLKMEVGTSNVNVGVFDDIFIIGYKDGQEVYNAKLQTAVLGGISIGSIFTNGGAHDVTFSIDKDVDEIALRLNSLVNATVSIPDVRLYYIVQDCTAADFVAWKSADKSSVKGGEEIEYTIHIRNTGTVNLNGASIEDMLPANTTYVSGGTLVSGKVTFPLMDVAIGETKTVSFKVKVNSNLTGVTEILNTALVNGIETFPSLPNNANEPDTTATEKVTKVPVDQIKSVVSWKAYDVNGDTTITSVTGGESVAYYIYVRNTGNQDLTNVTVSDVLPAGMTWVSGGTHSGGTVTFIIPTLGVGATSSALRFVAQVDNDLSGITEIKNIAVAKVDSNDPGTESFPPVDNSNPTEPDTTKPSGTVLETTPIHDVEVSKVGVSNNATNNAQAQVGDQVTYTITVKNIGNKTLSNLIVQDILPALFKNVVSSDGVVTGNTFTGTIATLGVDDEQIFTITSEVDNLNGATIIENTVIVTFRNEDDSADVTKSATDKMATSCTAIDANDIVLSESSLTVCSGENITVTASTGLPLTNPVYSWYTNAALTGTPYVGETLTVVATVNTTYYVTLEADGYCFTTPAAEVEVIVNSRPITPIIEAEADIGTDVCEGTVVTIKSNVADGNTWYKDGVLLVGLDTQEIDVLDPGTYTSVIVDPNLSCPSMVSNPIVVTHKPTPDLTINGDKTYSKQVGESLTLPMATSTSPGATVKWYDSSGNELTNTTITYTAIGVYYYYASSTIGSCSTSDWIQVVVSDYNACALPDERVWATIQSIGGSGGATINGPNAVTGEPYSHSTLTSVVGLLGLGSAAQRLEFNHVVPAGTPVTIKLGAEYSGLALAGAISVVGYKRNSLGTPIDIGPIKPASGNLLSLLSGSNSFEYTFIPTRAGKPRDYDGVKIIVGSLLGAAQSAKVYGAYYKVPSTTNTYDCSLSEVRDIYYGTYAPVIDALGSTNGVANEWLAVDGDPDTSAMMYLGAAVANQTYMNVEFRTPFKKNDILQITMAPEVGLSVDLLTGLVIRRYLGNKQVGSDITQFNFLDLISVNNKKKVIVPLLEPYEPFDRIEIFKAGVANVLGFIEIYEIERLVSPENMIDDMEIVDNKGFVISKAICLGGQISLNSNSEDGCTSYLWYDENNTLVGTGTTWNIPSSFGVGEHKVYLQPVRFNCENLNRTEINFTIEQCSKDCIISNPMLTNKLKK